MKRNKWKQAAVFALSGLMAASLAGCMPTESSKPQGETTVSQTQAESQGTAESAKAEGLKVNTTDPITLRMNWWGGRQQASGNIGRNQGI